MRRTQQSVDRANIDLDSAEVCEPPPKKSREGRDEGNYDEQEFLGPSLKKGRKVRGTDHDFQHGEEDRLGGRPGPEPDSLGDGTQGRTGNNNPWMGMVQELVQCGVEQELAIDKVANMIRGNHKATFIEMYGRGV